ncbi:MAG: YbjQ family protein [Gammaproteobacteria bacterium]|nr:YbjQ family protein [Gammaproteobacteria bacterium]MBU1444484.1 YbjQ family protein [Gammaproteobacteria bacterium]MBU2287316.1 YbjQ family protein [Gammaproteobacteria bacterium]MBU2407150.1 YbjQ family protein [Gammaproteobacteria bacterium]
MNANMVTSALQLPGWDIVDNVGIVRGIVVRSRSIVGNFFGGLQTILGGNITVYTSMCERARKDAYDIMCRQAELHRANAIVAMEYDTTEIMRGVTEVLCYGTAVIVQKRTA